MLAGDTLGPSSVLYLSLYSFHRSSTVSCIWSMASSCKSLPERGSTAATGTKLLSSPKGGGQGASRVLYLSLYSVNSPTTVSCIWRMASSSKWRQIGIRLEGAHQLCD